MAKTKPYNSKNYNELYKDRASKIPLSDQELLKMSREPDFDHDMLSPQEYERLCMLRDKAEMPARDDLIAEIRIPHGYELLFSILREAFQQAAEGKGKERHAGGLPWKDQPILSMARLLKSPAGPAQQVIKKTQEACVSMRNRNDYKAAKAEMLGAIVYAAAVYRFLEEEEENYFFDLGKE